MPSEGRCRYCSPWTYGEIEEMFYPDHWCGCDYYLPTLPVCAECQSAIKAAEDYYACA